MKRNEIIKNLEANGCSAENWENIFFPDSLNPSQIKNVSFYGKCNIATRENVCEINGVPYRSGIYNAIIKDCDIKEGSLVMNVYGELVNYEVASDVVIANVGSIVFEQGSTCGLGTPIAVLNENGGRSIPLSLNITAQSAYFSVLYRHDKDILKKFYFGDEDKDDKGYIGCHSKIIGCREIKNVFIDDGSTLINCSRLENGTIYSFLDEGTCKDNGIVVHTDVIAKDFVFMPGAQITNGAIIERCFVGEGTQIGNGFSATDCIFCSNCQAFHGEACSVFAGPFTVTHHKSTLLIAGMFSFMNAGSNTNQSNHYYRLGPNHEGILQRGSKTASGSYILWPAITGVFSLVKGKHGGNLDTRILPFSYLIEQDGETWIYPGMSLKSSGTARDILKWEKRDKRYKKTKEQEVYYYPQDVINFDVRSPFVIQQVIDGIAFLEKKQHHHRKEGVHYHKYGRAKIHSVAVDEGLDLYNYYLASYISFVFDGKDITPSKLVELAQKDNGSAWIDVCGVWARKSDTDTLLQSFRGYGEFYDGINKTNDAFEENRLEWTCAMVLNRYFDGEPTNVSQDKIDELISKGKDAQTTLDKLIATDREREYSEFMQVGYGIDDKNIAPLDFKAVQGF